MIGVALVAAEVSPAPARDIVFARRAGNRTVPLLRWRMGPDGSNPRPFISDTAGLGSMNTPDWSPDSTRLVFVARLANDVPAIFVANADGSGVTRIGPAGFGVVQWPAWSPSGREILFSAGPSVSAFSIYVMNADGSNIRRLTSDTGTQNCGRSPDGSRIMFASRRPDGTQQLVVMARDGSSPEVLVPGHNGDCGDWSPDGKRFAFFSIDTADNTSLAHVTSSLTTIDLASRARTSLVRIEGVSARPRWSPDARRIVFHSKPPAGPTAPGGRLFATEFQIYTIAADGSNLTRLTNNQFTDTHPVW
jgi:Tol biopolymer transport system component